MKPVSCLACLVVAWSLGHAAWAAEGPLVLDVWPGPAAGDHGTIGPERVRTGDEAPTADAQWRSRYLPELTAKLNLGPGWTLDLDASASGHVLLMMRVASGALAMAGDRP